MQPISPDTNELAPALRESIHFQKHICILFTGGTLGMEPDPVTGGLTVVPGLLNKQMEQMTELHGDNSQMPTYEIVEFDPLLDSSDMSPDDWVKIADAVESRYFDFDGFLIISGTDTMAYLASALSFMLENLAKPVIITGSQIPFGEVYNDARRNLIISMIFACREDFLEVCIYFHDRLLRGNRSHKVHSFRVDAFDSPNFPRLAEVGVNITCRKDLALRVPRRPFRVDRRMNRNILVIKLVPGFDDVTIIDMITQSKNLRAIVLEMYGTGNAPARRTGLVEAIKIARSKDILVAAISQCLTGSVMLGKYAVGDALAEAGVVSAGDMTTEACVTKIGYLLGRTNIKEAEELLQVNIRGELTGSNDYEKNFFVDRKTLLAL
jgi:L-asparaginase